MSVTRMQTKCEVLSVNGGYTYLFVKFAKLTLRHAK